MRVAILYSQVERILEGKPDELIAEQDILKTVEGVGQILEELGHSVIKIKFDKNIYPQIRKEKPDIVFNLCDSFEGPNILEASIPAILEILDVPYTGSGVFALSLCLNKGRTKEILTHHKVPNAKFQLFRDSNDRLNKKLSFPLIVKPNEQDASIGIRKGCVVNNEPDLNKKILELMGRYKQDIIVEEFVDGREFDVCVIGNKEPTVLPISETVYKNFKEGDIKICYYEAKWIKEDEHYDDIDSDFPAKIPRRIEEKMKRYAKKAYLTTGCGGYARIEMRLKGTTPYVIEVNPNPDLTVGGLFFDLARLVGMENKDLIQTIIDFGFEKHKRKNECKN